MRRTTLALVAPALLAGTLASVLPQGGRASGPVQATEAPTAGAPTMTATFTAPTFTPTLTPTIQAPTGVPTDTPTITATAGTPVVDPGPGTPSATPSPPTARICLPNLMQGYDPRLPGPITTTIEGYVAKLNAEGRAACAPATHILLRRPEGEPGADPLALLVRAGTDPRLELDLYLGDYVEVQGEGDLAAEACRDLSWQLIGVRAIRVIEVPPGGP